MKKIIFCCQVGLILFSIHAFSQNNNFIVRGKVISGEDQSPLPWANVFIAKSSIGTQTSTDGTFELRRLPFGKFNLVVSFIGFETLVLALSPQEQKYYTIILKPSAKRLKEIVVRSKKLDGSKWNNDLEIFKQYFIGQSENAKECFLKNKDVLQFDNEVGLFKAKADSVLIMENQALGYRLNFLIEQFEYDKLNKKLFYKGQVLYEPLIPKDETQNKLWAANRLKAYRGSEMHFMRALYERRMIEEGFTANLFPVKGPRNLFSGKAVADTTMKMYSDVFKRNIRMRTITHYNRILDSVASLNGETILSFNGKLEVTYLHEPESKEYSTIRAHRKSGFTFLQVSSVELENGGVRIEPNGTILQEENLPTKGYWSWELNAESLPVDYDPMLDLKIVENPTVGQQ